MFKKRSKKGLSHVDWAMSLAIFLLYLAWFFIFVKPLFAPSSSMDVLLDIVDDGVRDNLFLDIDRVRIYLPEAPAQEYVPIVIPYYYDWVEHDIAHSADYFVIDNNRMFFLANLSNTSTLSMFHPHEALKLTAPRMIDANGERARSGSFGAHFDDHLLEWIGFDGEERISSFSVEVDETDIDGTGVHENNTFMSKYTRRGDSINISSYVFAENSQVYSIITPTDYRNHSVQIDMATYNYTHYYIDPMSQGEVRYGIGPNCRYYETDFLDLYSSDSGVLITFSRDISMRLCANETTPTVRLEFDMGSSDDEVLMLLLHDGKAEDVLEYPLTPVVGMTETLNTVSAEKVALLRNRDNDYIRQLFRYPSGRDFNITVTSEVIDASYGYEQPFTEDIYAKRIDGVMLDENYEPKRALITLTVW